MACNKCKKNKCTCVKVISRLGVKGPPGVKGKGLRGDAGPPGPAGGRVVFQTSAQSSFEGVIGASKTVTGLEANLGFGVSAAFFLLWVDFGVSAVAGSTLTYYFLKNGVQAGPSRTRTVQPADHIDFKTDLISFTSSDTVSFFISSTNPLTTITTGVSFHSLKQT